LDGRIEAGTGFGDHASKLHVSLKLISLLLRVMLFGPPVSVLCPSPSPSALKPYSPLRVRQLNVAVLSLPRISAAPGELFWMVLWEMVQPRPES